jgi:L-aminopeptidase/D-esterase-like protein
VQEAVETGATIVDALYRATVEGTEEAVTNALFTADTVVGRGGHTAPGFLVIWVLPLLTGDARADA